MNYSISCQYSTRLIEKLKLLDVKNTLDFNLINKAVDWAKRYHADQFRKSGEPFYTHPIEVAYMASDYILKTDVIVASILHDIVEDTEVTTDMILDGYGHRIEEIVDRLTRDKPSGIKYSVTEILNVAYTKRDKEVLLIKLIDRLHNMQTIGAMTYEKQQKISNETVENFLSLCFDLEQKDIIQLLLDQINIITSHNLKYSKTNPIHYKSYLSLDFQNELIQKYSQLSQE
jgi:guanosine-3',5'-bis(diphosphate) 3'-pyrophosphohydrolase